MANVVGFWFLTRGKGERNEGEDTGEGREDTYRV